MDFVGIDLHKTSSQICTLSEGGEITERRIKSTKASFDEVFAGKPPARILVEASTESEWVACHLEWLGHEVIVADPNFAPMYATRDKKIKTDKRDARALCEACRLRCLPPRLSHLRASAEDQGAALDQVDSGAHPLEVHLADRRTGTPRGLPHRDRRLRQFC
jgi:transposase